MDGPDAPPPRRRRAAALWFILVTLGIDALGVGIVIPIVPELVRLLSGRGPSSASVILGLMVATFALAQLLAAPVIGGLSDRFGRRPIMLLSIAGIAINYLLLAWAPSIAWLFLGRVFAGVTSANMSTASAYIADISTPMQRAQRFGLVGAVFSAGFVLGPATGGLLGAFDLRLPFLVAAGLAACNALFGLFVLPESLPPERRQPFTWKGSNPVSAIRELAADPLTCRLAIAWACMWFSLGTIQTVFVLSTTLRFGWDTMQNGAALALVGVCGALVQGVLVRFVVPRLGERRTALDGFVCSGFAYAILAFATQGWEVYPAVIVQAFGAMANPSIRAMLSTHAGPDRQGHIMGSLAAVEGITAIVSPLIASALFFVFAGPGALVRFAGAPFLAACLGYVVAGLAIRGVRLLPAEVT